MEMVGRILCFHFRERGIISNILFFLLLSVFLRRRLYSVLSRKKYWFFANNLKLTFKIFFRPEEKANKLLI